MNDNANRVLNLSKQDEITSSSAISSAIGFIKSARTTNTAVSMQ